MVYLCDAVFKEASLALQSFFTLLDHSTTEPKEEVEAFFNYAMGQIEWNGNFFEILKDILDTNWLVETLQGFLKTLEVSVNDFSTQIDALVQQFMEALKLAIGIASVLFLLAL